MLRSSFKGKWQQKILSSHWKEIQKLYKEAIVKFLCFTSGDILMYKSSYIN